MLLSWAICVNEPKNAEWSSSRKSDGLCLIDSTTQSCEFKKQESPSLIDFIAIDFGVGRLRYRPCPTLASYVAASMDVVLRYGCMTALLWLGTVLARWRLGRRPRGVQCPTFYEDCAKCVRPMKGHSSTCSHMRWHIWPLEEQPLAR